MMENKTDANADAGRLQCDVGPADEAELIAGLQREKNALLQRAAEVQRQINAARGRQSAHKRQAKAAKKEPRPSLKHRNILMTLAAIEGQTLDSVGLNFGLSSERVRQCIDRVLRSSMHPARWGATHGAPHPRTISAARLQKEPLVSVLRTMLDEPNANISRVRPK